MRLLEDCPSFWFGPSSLVVTAVNETGKLHVVFRTDYIRNTEHVTLKYAKEASNAEYVGLLYLPVR